jgi:hypothetical protein
MAPGPPPTGVARAMCRRGLPDLQAGHSSPTRRSSCPHSRAARHDRSVRRMAEPVWSTLVAIIMCSHAVALGHTRGRLSCYKIDGIN